jgi:hypothetical protein
VITLNVSCIDGVELEKLAMTPTRHSGAPGEPGISIQ